MLATCIDCTGGETRAVVAAYLGVVLGIGLAFAALEAVRRRLPQRIEKQFERFWEASNPHNKAKILIGFYMIATQIDAVYNVTFPASVRAVLAKFYFGITIGLGNVNSVLACLGIYGFFWQLVFWTVLPLALVLLTVIGSVICLACTRRLLYRRALLKSALPLITRMLFLLYPVVTNVAFQAFSCHEFDDGARAVLIADISIECNTPVPFGDLSSSSRSVEHDEIMLLAAVAVCVYPIGLLLLNGAFLCVAHKAILSDKGTPLSLATRFLYREYQKPFFWWELVEMFRRLFLVGIMVIVRRGSLTQLVIGSLFSVVYLLVQMQAMPFRSTADDYLANACSFALVVVFVCSIMFKVRLCGPWTLHQDG